MGRLRRIPQKVHLKREEFPSRVPAGDRESAVQSVRACVLGPGLLADAGNEPEQRIAAHQAATSCDKQGSLCPRLAG